MKKRDFQLIIGILVIAAIGIFVSLQLARKSDAENYVVIYVGENEYRHINLSEPQTVTVEQNGHTNEIVINEDRVYMQSASCDNKDCIKQGVVTLDSIETRITGGWIICLPNLVSVELRQAD